MKTIKAIKWGIAAAVIIAALAVWLCGTMTVGKIKNSVPASRAEETASIKPTPNIQTPALSELVTENENAQSVFAVSVEDFIECYNDLYQKEHGKSYLTPITTDDWYCYPELSPRFGYEAVRYQFSEDKTVWPMPTVSVYAADKDEIYEIRMVFDDHGYQERLYIKFKDLCFCLMKMACPEMTDAETEEAFSELYSLAYDNFFADHHAFGDPERPPLSKLLQYENIGFYCFYGSGNIELCMIPLTPHAMELLDEEGANVEQIKQIIS